MLHNILAEHVHLVQILVQAEERFWSTLYISRPAAMSDRAEVASKISDLADLLGERKERIAHAVKIIFENKMCLHCSRVYLRGMAQRERCTAVRPGLPSPALNASAKTDAKSPAIEKKFALHLQTHSSGCPRI